jgi:hypothetical protein
MKVDMTMIRAIYDANKSDAQRERDRQRKIGLDAMRFVDDINALLKELGITKIVAGMSGLYSVGVFYAKSRLPIATPTILITGNEITGVWTLVVGGNAQHPVTSTRDIDDLAEKFMVHLARLAATLE